MLHFHIHLQDSPNLGFGEGIPLYFYNYQYEGRYVERGIPGCGETEQVVENVPSRYGMRNNDLLALPVRSRLFPASDIQGLIDTGVVDNYLSNSETGGRRDLFIGSALVPKFEGT